MAWKNVNAAKQSCQSAFTFKTTGHLHDCVCVWIVDTKIFLFFRSISTIVISWQKLLLVKAVSDL